MINIRFCEHNLSLGAGEVVEKIKREYPDADIIVNPCLHHCGACSDGPYALVGDELVSAKTPDELYESIVKRLG